MPRRRGRRDDRRWSVAGLAPAAAAVTGGAGRLGGDRGAIYCEGVTLVLSVLTQEHVIQVSDRRLVRHDPATAQAELLDDEANKAVLWRGRLAFAYTGLADLGRDRQTDLWLAHTLAAVQEEARGVSEPQVMDQRHLLERLAERCTVSSSGARRSKCSTPRCGGERSSRWGGQSSTASPSSRRTSPACPTSTPAGTSRRYRSLRTSSRCGLAA
jgi:hypothetical protein